MGFLSPISFLFLSMLAILIAFYFFKKQFDRRIISSTYLWNQTIREQETNRWHNKLKRNLLLLLQLLIMLALIFALTRPYLISEGIDSEHLVIIMDTSATMTVKEEKGTRFEIAKETAVKLVNQLSTDQVVTLINGRKAPELLAVNETDHRKVKQLIQGLALSYEDGNMIDSMKLAQSLIHSPSGEIHLFSDTVKKQDMQDLTLSHPLTVHNIGTISDNVSLQSFGVKMKDEKVNGVVTVLNEGSHSKNILIKLLSDGKKLKQLTETIPPQSEVVIQVNDLSKQPIYEAVIDEQDVYLLDNRSYAVLGKQKTPLLYIAGHVNPFVIKALQAFGTEVISVPQNDDNRYVFADQKEDSIYLLAGVPADQWPSGPKLIFSPTEGGPFQIKRKRELSLTLSAKRDPLLHYVDSESVYLVKSFPIGNTRELQPVVTTGEDTVIAKGLYEGSRIVLGAFDIQDSDWPLHPSFPVFLNNVITYLTENQQTVGVFLPNEREELTYSPSTIQAHIANKDGSKVHNVNLTSSVLQVPSEPGLYQLNEKAASELISRYFAVEIADEERTARVEPSFSITINNEKNSTQSAAKHEIWHWFVIVGMMLLFIEWEVYRRGIRGR